MQTGADRPFQSWSRDILSSMHRYKLKPGRYNLHGQDTDWIFIIDTAAELDGRETIVGLILPGDSGAEFARALRAAGTQN